MPSRFLLIHLFHHVISVTVQKSFPPTKTSWTLALLSKLLNSILLRVSWDLESLERERYADIWLKWIHFEVHVTFCYSFIEDTIFSTIINTFIYLCFFKIWKSFEVYRLFFLPRAISRALPVSWYCSTLSKEILRLNLSVFAGFQQKKKSRRKIF